MIVPDWLTEKKNFNATKKKMPFLIKNRHVFKTVLEKFTTFNNDKKMQKVTINPVLRFLVTILLIIYTDCSQSAISLWILSIYLGVQLILLDDATIIVAIKRCFLTALVPIAIFLPTLFFNRFNSLFLWHTAIISGIITMYGIKTNFYLLLLTLKSLRLPNVVLLQLDITIKYILIYSQLLLQFLQAIEVRTFNEQLKSSVGMNLIGILFLKSKERALQIENAMEARCFTGVYSKKKFHFYATDRYYLVFHLILGILFLVEGSFFNV